MRNVFVLFGLLLVSLGNAVISVLPSHTVLTPNGRVEFAYQEPGQTKEHNSHEKCLKTSFLGKPSSTTNDGIFSLPAEGPVVKFGTEHGDGIGFLI